VGALTYLKAGASTIEPAGAPDDQGVVRLNVDKGKQMNSGANALLLGDARNGAPGCAVDAPFVLATRQSDASITVQADAAGGTWPSSARSRRSSRRTSCTLRGSWSSWSGGRDRAASCDSTACGSQSALPRPRPSRHPAT
jgi:hypothetical protein